MKTKFIKIFPIFFFCFLTVILFRPFVFKGLLPIPGDILIGHYYPLKDEVWEGRLAGYPIKNFLLYDGIRQTLPWRLLSIEQIKSGKIPLWNPYILSGMPLLGNIQTAAFYPLNFLFFLFRPLIAWSLYIFLQPILAGLFAYFFARTINGSKVAALLSGTTYAFSLIMMNHLEFGIDGHTALWLPLAITSVNKIQTSGKKKWGVLLFLSLLMTSLGGYPPPAIYNFFITGLYVLFKIKPLFSKKLLLTIMMLILAFGVAAPQLFPSYELANKVIRKEEEFGASGNYFFFPLENLAMVLAPDLYGHPSTNNFFSTNQHVDNQSIGIIGFLFVCFGFITVFKKKESAFWAITAVLPILFMLRTPLSYGLEYLGISFLSLVTPLRMSWVVIFAFSALSGVGFDYLKEIIEKKRPFYHLALPLFAVWEMVFLLMIGVNLFLKEDFALIANKNMVLPTFFLFLATIVIFLMVLKPKLISFLGMLIVFFCATELIRQGIKYNPFISEKLIFPEVGIFEKIKDGDSFRLISTNQEFIPANSNMPYHLSMVDGYASIYDGRYGQLLRHADFSYPVEKIEGYPRIVFQSGYQSDILGLLGAKYFLSFEDLPEKDFLKLSEKGRTKLFQNNKVFPKAFLVSDFAVGKSDLELINALLKADLKKTVILEKPPVQTYNADRNDGKIQLLKYTEDRVEMEVVTSRPAILVSGDSYDSGWKGFIDNKNTKILRADYNIRAMEIPSGKHRVEFIYQPASFYCGCIVSLLCLSAFTILVKKWSLKN